METRDDAVAPAAPSEGPSDSTAAPRGPLAAVLRRLHPRLAATFDVVEDIVARWEADDADVETGQASVALTGLQRRLNMWGLHEAGRQVAALRARMIRAPRDARRAGIEAARLVEAARTALRHAVLAPTSSEEPHPATNDADAAGPAVSPQGPDADGGVRCAPRAGTLLLINLPLDDAVAIGLAARRVGLDAYVEPSIDGALTMLQEGRRPLPDVLVFEPAQGAGDAAGHAFIDWWDAAGRSVPMVIHTTEDSWAQRRTYVERGIQHCVERPAEPGLVVTVCQSLVGQGSETAMRINLLSRRHDVAAWARACEARRVTVVTFSEAQALSRDMERDRPDAIVIDDGFQDPDASTEAVVQTIRQDPVWDSVPIQCIVAGADLVRAQRILDAGADDVIRAPVPAPLLAARVIARIRRSNDLRRQSARDPVTGLLEARELDQRARSLARAAAIEARPLVVAVVRFDDLEGLMHRHGRGTAHDALRRLAQTIKQHTLPQEVVGALPQGDIGCVLAGASNESSIVRLKDALTAFQSQPLASIAGGIGIHGTASAGISVQGPDATGYEALLDVARGRLSAARATGPGIVEAGFGSPQRQRSRIDRATDEPELEPDVLIIDGDKDVVDLVEHGLRTRGVTTVAFSNGQEASERLLHPVAPIHPRVVLLDVDLAGIDGLTLLRRLRDHGRLESIAVLLVTGSARESDILAGLRLGASDHVAKPFRLRLLIQRVLNMLEARL